MIITKKRGLIGQYPFEYFYWIGNRWSFGFYKFKIYGTGTRRIVFKYV
jgi:hypothetical protein